MKKKLSALWVRFEKRVRILQYLHYAYVECPLNEDASDQAFAIGEIEDGHYVPLFFRRDRKAMHTRRHTKKWGKHVQ